MGLIARALIFYRTAPFYRVKKFSRDPSQTLTFDNTAYGQPQVFFAVQPLFMNSKNCGFRLVGHGLSHTVACCGVWCCVV